jgi:hypothetical protein
MPQQPQTYTVTHPTTGQSLDMTGPRPPTEVEIKAAFAQAGTSQDPGKALAKAEKISPVGWPERAAEYLPLVGGVAGGIIGGVSSAGPGAVPGAAAGGLIGKRLQHYVNALTGAHQLPEAGTAMREMAGAAVEQGLTEAGGQVVGGVIKGGMLSRAVNPEIAAANTRFGLGLSGPEITQGSRVGHVGEALQAFTTRSMTGRTITQTARQKGEANALKVVEDALDQIAPQGTPLAAGRAAQAGVKAAQKGQQVVGQRFGQVVKEGPDIDLLGFKADAQGILDTQLRPLAEQTSGAARMKALAQELQTSELTEQEIQSQFPSQIPKTIWEGLAPDHPIMAAAIAAAREAREGQIAHLLKQAETLTQKKLQQSPSARKIFEILKMEDTVDFPTLVKFRTGLREAGKAPDELLGTETKGLITHLHDRLTTDLTTAHPAFAVAGAEYRGGARLLQSRLVRNVVKNDPEAILTALKRNTPSRVLALREALLGLAGKGREAAEGQAAWTTLRRRWFEEAIVKGPKGTADMAGMGARLSKTDPGVLQAFYGMDAPGRTLVANAQAIGNALQARHPLPTGRMYEILELAGAGSVAMSGHPGAAAVSLGAMEGLPGLLTWAMYNPTITKYLTTGLTTRNPGLAISNLARVGQAYKLYQQQKLKQAQGEAQVPATPDSVTPSAPPTPGGGPSPEEP